ncbi:RNA polymerase sigma factor [Flavobacterium caeni]|uniref:RNA polymerase sigma-70 factor, ECF subfamily n=1 Tax=Flavobacterium caeni TaxID=490189 RepID=A0A1G5CD38_9FLAO|nr:sigma-70 family RNA polymerase sigma factor [Flavobacterium caeni]SCY00208.1 RNA polymerase sigma-70 factor, ECF subfamily [Flavobacterium caeni]
MEEKEFIAQLLDPRTQNQAFQKLMAQYQRPLYSHIRAMVIDHDDADDVLQNTFVKVFQHLKGFKGESKLFSWMYRIATNEAITLLNQRAKRGRITSEELYNKKVDNLKADQYFDGNEIQLKLQNAIATLPDKQRLVFNMKYFEEIKYEDMSEILGTSVGALKASYHHAVKKIEDYMNKN